MHFAPVQLRFATREAAEEFIAGDPFVIQGLVASWRVLEWNAAFL